MTLVRPEDRSIDLRRLHSLTGVVPLGLFFAAHLSLNLVALQGSQAFEDTVRYIQAWPGLVVLELLGIHLPLVFHAGMGLLVTSRSELRASLRSTPPRWAYVLQRVTGICTLTFLVYHLAMLRIPLALGHLDPMDLHPRLVSTLSSTTASGIPVHAIFYLVGLASASYHLGNGLSTFSRTWGLWVSPRGVTVSRVASATAGATLFVLGALTVLHYATGSGFASRSP